MKTYFRGFYADGTAETDMKKCINWYVFYNIQKSYLQVLKIFIGGILFILSKYSFRQFSTVYSCSYRPITHDQ